MIACVCMRMLPCMYECQRMILSVLFYHVLSILLKQDLLLSLVPAGMVAEIVNLKQSRITQKMQIWACL